MKSAEIPAFPIDKFLAAGIPREATVELWVSGGYWVYGEIKDPRQIGSWPAQAELMDIAYEDQCSEVRCVEVECNDGGMKVAQTLRFEFEGGAAEEFLLMESHRHPIAARGVWFSCGQVLEPAALRVADLTFMTFREGDIWLEGKRIKWADEDYGSDCDYQIIADGKLFTTREYWFYGGPGAQILDGLMTLQRHSRSFWGLIPRSDAERILRDRPEHWTAVARDFIQRHGRADAELIIGACNLDALLRGELWEWITKVRVEDKRQLQLWPHSPNP